MKVIANKIGLEMQTFQTVNAELKIRSLGIKSKKKLNKNRTPVIAWTC